MEYLISGYSINENGLIVENNTGIVCNYVLIHSVNSLSDINDICIVALATILLPTLLQRYYRKPDAPLSGHPVYLFIPIFNFPKQRYFNSISYTILVPLNFFPIITIRPSTT